MLLINLDREAKFTVTVKNDLKVLVAKGNGIHRDITFVRGLKRAVSWVGKIISKTDPQREEYHLTGDGNHLSKLMLLNGRKLEIEANGEIPTMDPILIPLSSPVTVTPLSIVFVVFPNLEAKACG